MLKFKVKLQWSKHIDFGIIEAKDKDEAIKKADEMLGEKPNELTEINDGEDWEVIEEGKDNIKCPKCGSNSEIIDERNNGYEEDTICKCKKCGNFRLVIGELVDDAVKVYDDDKVI
jgi:DNA-directed RNA polymerase subunit M/transcription elongation factor TFIIS